MKLQTKSTRSATTPFNFNPDYSLLSAPPRSPMTREEVMTKSKRPFQQNCLRKQAVARPASSLPVSPATNKATGSVAHPIKAQKACRKNDKATHTQREDGWMIICSMVSVTVFPLWTVHIKWLRKTDTFSATSSYEWIPTDCSRTNITANVSDSWRDGHPTRDSLLQAPTAAPRQCLNVSLAKQRALMAEERWQRRCTHRSLINKLPLSQRVCWRTTPGTARPADAVYVRVVWATSHGTIGRQSIIVSGNPGVISSTRSRRGKAGPRKPDLSSAKMRAHAPRLKYAKKRGELFQWHSRRAKFYNLNDDNLATESVRGEPRLGIS